MDKKFITLANQIHEGRNICLNKLILGSLYESLGIASFELKSINHHDDNILISIPIWILQIWIDATFEPSLKVTILSDSAFWPKKPSKTIYLCF